MAGLTINKDDLYNSNDIESGVQSKLLLDYHLESYSGYQGHIDKSINKIKVVIDSFNEIKERISSSEQLTDQLKEIDSERQALIKKRNDYFQSKKFTEPDQLALIHDSEIRQHLNKDENYEYIGSVLNPIFNLTRLNGNARYAEAILRQSQISMISIPLTNDQIDLLKDIAYNGINSQYWPMLDDLDTIEEQLTLNRQTMSDTLSGLLEKLL